MSQHRWSWHVERVIPSERGAGQAVIDEVLEKLRDHSWFEHDVFGVRLALEEAIVNAIHHGNQLDRKKTVHVVGKLSEQRFWIQISDEGAGFRPEAVPDCTNPENLDKPSGRGLMLMRCYMTRVTYSPRGNIVVMEKERQQAS